MDSWEFNKIAGAVLAALLLAFGSGTFADIFRPNPHGDDHGQAHVGYKLPVTVAAAGKTEAPGGAAAAAFDPNAVMGMMKTASVESGQAVFGQCRSCHTPDKGGKPGTGPNLWGVVGRDIASSPDFPRYSAALKKAEGNWDYTQLIEYLHDPKRSVPGNQMSFAGVKKPQELADLMAYLRSLSDAPPPMPN